MKVSTAISLGLGCQGKSSRETWQPLETSRQHLRGESAKCAASDKAGRYNNSLQMTRLTRWGFIYWGLGLYGEDDRQGREK